METDQFYVMAEDGITKLAGPFESEDAAIAEIEKAAEEVAAETAEKEPAAAAAGTIQDLKKSVQEISARSTKAEAAKAESTFGEKFWALVKDAVSLPSWGAALAPNTGGDTEKQSSDAADQSTDSVSSGSHIVIQVIPAAENQAAGLSVSDGAEEADGSDNVQKFAIAKRDDEQRFTYGVAYPAGRLDVHKDFMDATDLEKSAWAFYKKANSGTMHTKGTDGAGEVVESHIWRGPVTKFGDEEVRPGDWMLGVVWGQPTWDRIVKGELKGYSFQGFAKRNKSAAPA